MKSASEVLLFLLVDLAIIIVAARSFGALAKKLGQPAVIGEIVAGILLGPTVLGRVFPGLPAQIFPAEVPLRPLADLGLVFFMFLVGLELDPRLVRKEGRRALAISLSGVVVPFTLGALLGVRLLALNNGGVFGEGVTHPPTALAFSLFMGAAMCITAFPVLARILVERGLYKSPLGTTALCAAAVDDVTAWILLAAVVGITRTGSAAQAATTFALTGVFAVFMLTAGRGLLQLLAKRYEASGRLTVDQVAAVIAGLLLAAYLTELIGIHSIFGAFVFGSVMPRESRMTRELTDKIEDFTVVVLLPVFFAVAGLRTNLFAINSPGLLFSMLLVVAAAIVGKLAGCGLAARLNGYSTRDSLTLGTLMNTRGLTELVILTVGLSLGVLSDRTFAMMVVMALVTTFMAAPIVNRLMPRREMVRVLAGGDPGPMARRVLVAIGNPDDARPLVEAGIRLTGVLRPSELLLARMIPTARAPEFRSGMRDEESQVDRSVEAMDTLAHQATRAGVNTRAVSFLSDDVGQDLAYIASTQRCDTVLFGWHRASRDHQAVRALVHRVFMLAPCDVIVFVDRMGPGVQRGNGRPVLVAFANDEDRGVLEIGQRLADSLQTTVQRVGCRGSDDNGRPALDVAVEESAKADVAVIAVGGTWTGEEDFGQPATAFVAATECPLLIVRPAERPPAQTRAAGASATERPGMSAK